MGIQYTTNFGIAYADSATALADLDDVTQQIAQSLDAAMGRAGYTPPNSTDFAALSARVTTIETNQSAYRWATLVSSANNYSLGIATGAFADLSGYSGLTLVVPNGKELELEYSLPKLVTGAGQTAYLRLLANGGILDATERSSSASTSDQARLTGSVIGTGAAVTISVQGLASAAGCSAQGSSTAGRGPKLRYRISAR